MNDNEKIEAIKKVYAKWRKGSDIDGREFDSIDCVMEVERIVNEK